MCSVFNPVLSCLGGEANLHSAFKSHIIVFCLDVTVTHQPSRLCVRAEPFLLDYPAGRGSVISGESLNASAIFTP